MPKTATRWELEPRQLHNNSKIAWPTRKVKRGEMPVCEFSDFVGYSPRLPNIGEDFSPKAFSLVFQSLTIVGTAAPGMKRSCKIRSKFVNGGVPVVSRW